MGHGELQETWQTAEGGRSEGGRGEGGEDVFATHLERDWSILHFQLLHANQILG